MMPNPPQSPFTKGEVPPPFEKGRSGGIYQGFFVCDQSPFEGPANGAGKHQASDSARGTVTLVLDKDHRDSKDDHCQQPVKGLRTISERNKKK